MMMRRSQNLFTKPNGTSLSRRLFQWRNLVVITMYVAFIGNFVTSRQFFLKLSTSSMAWDSLEEASPGVEASPDFGGRANVYDISNTNKSELQVPGNHPVISAVTYHNNEPQAAEPQQPNRTIALWCFLDEASTYLFLHFPHTLQALSQCWSFFQSKEAELKAAFPPQNQSNQDKFEYHINFNRLAATSGNGLKTWVIFLLLRVSSRYNFFIFIQ